MGNVFQSACAYLLCHFPRPRATVGRCAATLLTIASILAGASGAQAHVQLAPISAFAVARQASAPNQAPPARTAAGSQPLTPAQIRSAYALPAGRRAGPEDRGDQRLGRSVRARPT